MKKRKIKIYAVFIVLLIAYGLQLTAVFAQTDYNAIKCKDVVDGDTIILENGEHLRYIGLDTPETRKRVGKSWVSDPQPFSMEAKELNASLVKDKVLRVEFDVQRQDKYNRLLGYCYVGGVFVNARLLEEGLAVIYTFPPNVKHTDLFVSLQKKARDAKSGIWKEGVTVSADKAKNYIGQIKTVYGRVVNVRQSPKAVYLNFGKDWQSDFTVVIFRKDLSLSDKERFRPKELYQGKNVSVTGRIREFKGPEIIVRHPSSIEIAE